MIPELHLDSFSKSMSGHMFPILKRLKEMGQQASKEAAEMGCIEAAEELQAIAASIASEEEERGG